MRWPEVVSRRLRARAGDAAPSVIQSTLSGQRLVTSFHFAPSMVERFERDILGKAGVRAVIVNVGVNDLGVAMMPPVSMYLPNTQVSADDLIEGFRELVAIARRAGVAIYGSTITPGSGFRHQGNPYWSPQQEATRRTVNAWLRRTDIFDGVFDFAAAVQNPLDEEYFAPWASADNTHPSDGGQYAIAEAVDLDRLLAAT
jgi:lysophospholipase L1-like esterase